MPATADLMSGPWFQQHSLETFLKTYNFGENDSLVENGQTNKQTNNNKQTNKQTIRQYRFTQSLGKGILRFTNMYQRTIMNGFWCNSFHVPCENIITSICDSSMMQMMLPI